MTVGARVCTCTLQPLEFITSTEAMTLCTMTFTFLQFSSWAQRLTCESAAHTAAGASSSVTHAHAGALGGDVHVHELAVADGHAVVVLDTLRQLHGVATRLRSEHRWMATVSATRPQDSTSRDPALVRSWRPSTCQQG